MRKENPRILNDFLNYLVIFKNYSKGTIREYNSDLLLFFNFLIKYLRLEINIREMNIFILTSVEESDIIAFLVFLNYDKDNCFRTRQRKMASIKTFYKWLFRHYPTFNNKKNPTKDIPYIEPTVRLPKYLKLDDARKIQKIFNISNSRNYIRDNTIITLFLNCGLRLSELANINIKDIDFNNRTINIIGKGNKERIIYLNKTAINSLKKYLNTKKVIDFNDPLFQNNRNKRISIYSIEKICKKAYKLAGLEEYEYTTHSLRHTAATYMYKKTKDILILKEFLGHESLDSTEIYMHLENDDIRKAVNSNPLNSYKSTKLKSVERAA